MKNIIIAAVFIISFSSCKKILSVSVPTHYISGHLYDKCGGVPVKNQGLYMHQNNLDPNENTKGTTTTDSNGYFKLEYNGNESSADFEIRYANSNYSVLILNGYNIINIDSAKLYGISTANIVVKLNVTNPKTSNDTLFVNNLNNPGTILKVSGPFVNGTTVYTASNFNLLVPRYKNSQISTTIKMGYYINTPPASYIDLDAIVCKNNIVTLNVN